MTAVPRKKGDLRKWYLIVAGGVLAKAATQELGCCKRDCSTRQTSVLLLSLPTANPKLQEDGEEIWLALKPRRQCRAMLLSHLDSLKAWRGGGAFCSACSQAQGKELVLNVCAYLPSTDAAWAPVCLLCQHQRSYYMTKWDLYSGSISAGLTRQNGQYKKMPVSPPLSARSLKASWTLHFFR